MKRSLLYYFSYPGVLIFLLLYCKSGGQNKANANTKAPKKKADTIIVANLLFAGDIMMHMPQIDAAYNDSAKKYDLSTVFSRVNTYIKGADFAVANLETTFGGLPYTGYPQFSSPDTLAWFIRQAGFDLLVTSNNHAADRGGKGISRTIDVLDGYDIGHTGTFKDSNERQNNSPYIYSQSIQTTKGEVLSSFKIAFLNYTYGTNGLTVPAPLIINYIDTAVISRDIQDARKKADAVVVIYHWGIEYQREPNEEQVKLAKFTLEKGATFIIGSHPHVLQPVVWQKYGSGRDSGLVAYSMGNFISNQRDRYKDGAMMLTVQVSKNLKTGKVQVKDPQFIPTWVYIQPDPKRYFILPGTTASDTSNFVVPDQKETFLQSLKDTREHIENGAIKEAGK